MFDNNNSLNTKDDSFKQLLFGSEHIIGSRDGAVVRGFASHRCGPGSIPRLGVLRGLSLSLALVLVPRSFSKATPVFPSPQKPTISNSIQSESVPIL